MEGITLRKLIDNLVVGQSEEIKIKPRFKIRIKKNSNTNFKISLSTNIRVDGFIPIFFYRKENTSWRFIRAVPNFHALLTIAIAILGLAYFEELTAEVILIVSVVLILIYFILSVLFGFDAYKRINKFLKNY